MNPFTIPFSGVSSWIELLLAVAGGIVMLIYVYQVFLPMISDALFSKPDYRERAAELLRKYQQQQDDAGASES